MGGGTGSGERDAEVAAIGVLATVFALVAGLLLKFVGGAGTGYAVGLPLGLLALTAVVLSVRGPVARWVAKREAEERRAEGDGRRVREQTTADLRTLTDLLTLTGKRSIGQVAAAVRAAVREERKTGAAGRPGLAEQAVDVDQAVDQAIGVVETAVRRLAGRGDRHPGIDDVHALVWACLLLFDGDRPALWGELGKLEIGYPGNPTAAGKRWATSMCEVAWRVYVTLEAERLRQDDTRG